MSVVADAIATAAEAKREEAEATQEAINQAVRIIGRSTRGQKVKQSDSELLQSLLVDGLLTPKQASDIEKTCTELWSALDTYRDQPARQKAREEAIKAQKEFQEKFVAKREELLSALRKAENAYLSCQYAHKRMVEIRSEYPQLFDEQGRVIDPAQKSKAQTP